MDRKIGKELTINLSILGLYTDVLLEWVCHYLFRSFCGQFLISLSLLLNAILKIFPRIIAATKVNILMFCVTPGL